jgi:hypothetical protein
MPQFLCAVILMYHVWCEVTKHVCKQKGNVTSHIYMHFEIQLLKYLTLHPKFPVRKVTNKMSDLKRFLLQWHEVKCLIRYVVSKLSYLKGRF